MGHKLWLSCLLLTIFLVQRAQTVCLEEERKALLEIKASLMNSYYSEAENVLPTWVDYGECCNWERVKCNKTNGRVTTLFLSNLRGNLDDDMTFTIEDPTVKLWPLNVSVFLPFEDLRTLNLSWNYLENEILSKELERLSSLKKLETLDFSSNFHIDNDILPSLTTLASLKILDLSYTSLNGYFPANEFSALENLERMDLSHCNFSDTFKLQGLEKAFILDKLESLNLRNNRFNESVISSLKILPSLKHLDLGGNSLSGSFPPHDIAYLTNLEMLDLSGNLWFNTSNQDIAYLTNLEMLDLSGNLWFNTSNQDCKRLTRLKRLKSISLRESNFNKNIISCLSALPSLNTLNLRGSHSLAGSFPFQELTGLKNLRTLDMGNCGLNSLVYNGTMSGLLHLTLNGNFLRSDTMRFLGAFPSLKFLSLSSSMLYAAALAEELQDMPSLEVLILMGNMFSGTLTMNALASFTNLKILDLSFNNLTGNIPTEIQAMSSLQVLSLAGNSFDGALPEYGLCELKKLEELDLHANNFEGNLPQCFDKFSSLKLFKISSNKFSGIIPPYLISNLTSLEYLDFSHNKFEGSLSFSSFANHSKLEVVEFISDNDKFEVETQEPIGWVPMFQLKVLLLSNCNVNRAKGRVVPSFLRSQHKLRVLDLSHNFLDEPFPTWLINNNTMLEVLYLRNNSFGDRIRMPPYRNVHLGKLDISGNHIIGTIPSDIGKFFPDLTFLNLSRNALSGDFPSSIANMSGLIILDLSDNEISGEVPQELFTDNRPFGVLDLSYNKLHGDVLSGNLSLHLSFNFLLLNNNYFTGKIENDVSKSFQLWTLDISNNLFSGVLPDWLSNSISLRTLSVRNNRFEGKLPCGIASFLFLDVSENSLSGSIPSCLDLQRMKHLHLGFNRFTGSIPRTFQTMIGVLTLDVGNNYLSGKIPEFLGLLSNLRILLMRKNNFSGSIPTQLCQLSNVTLIDLSGNSLYGSIPPCLQSIAGPSSLSYKQKTRTKYSRSSSYVYFSTLKSWSPTEQDGDIILETHYEVYFTIKRVSRFYKSDIVDYMRGLDLSNNKLTGEIPQGLGWSLTQICVLNFSHNQLTGSIPEELSNLANLVSLDLSSNGLSGNVPSQLTKLSYMASFNVSYNNLSGRLPDMKGQFSTFNAESYKGNPLLCGDPLEKKCVSTSPVTIPSGDVPSAKESEKWYDIDIIWFFGSLSATWALYLLGFAAILYTNPRWRRWWLLIIEECMYTCYYFLIDWVSRPSVFFRR